MKIQTPEWVRDAVFYQIFPDRFAKSLHNENCGLKFEPWESAPTRFGFKGGDLYGVKEHLDYLKDLGITAIYFNPINVSASNHRYHTYDYYHIDPLLGGDQAFRELIDAAHNIGMRIVMDGVFNHASRGFWQFHHVLENGDGSPYVDWFYFDADRLNRSKSWGAYPDKQEQRLLDQGVGSVKSIGYKAWWDLPALPKLNTNTPEVREFIWDVAVHWLDFGIDGWRLDVPAEIDDDGFWQEFRRRVKKANPEAYIVGEIWDESKRWLQGDQFDAVMNYLVTGALMGWLIGKKMPKYVYKVGGWSEFLKPLNVGEFSERIDYILDLYDTEINFAQLNLIDSHDTPRFLTVAGNDISALRLGYLFEFTYIGAPCIYYGDEIGLDGGPDPDCRKSFPWEERSWNKDLRRYMKELIELRKNQPALRRGTYKTVFAEEDVFAFERKYENETLLVVINAAKKSRHSKIDVSNICGIEGKITPIFGVAKKAVLNGNLLELRLEARSGIVLKVK